MATRHFKLAPKASIFYDATSKTKVVKNSAVSIPNKLVKKSKRLQAAIQGGHIVEIQGAEAAKLQAEHAEANKAKKRTSKDLKASLSPEAQIRLQDVELTSKDEDEVDEVDLEDDDDFDEDDDEFENLTKAELNALIEKLDPPATSQELASLKSAKAEELKNFLRTHKEDNE